MGLNKIQVCNSEIKKSECVVLCVLSGWLTNRWYGLIVRFTYNEASNVIMTVTGSASHMRQRQRGSEFCQRKQLCPGYRPMGLSRNSAFWKINNEQKQRKLSEFSMGSWANCVITKRIWLFTWVCLMWVSQWAWKKDRKNWGKISIARAEAAEDSMWKRFTETVLQATVTLAAATETNSMKITSCYTTAHAELAAGHWLMCQGSGRGIMGLSKFECWTLMMMAAVRWCWCWGIGSKRHSDMVGSASREGSDQRLIQSAWHTCCEDTLQSMMKSGDVVGWRAARWLNAHLYVQFRGVHPVYWATLSNGSAESAEECKENCPGETSETTSPDGLNVA